MKDQMVLRYADYACLDPDPRYGWAKEVITPPHVQLKEAAKGRTWKQAPCQCPGKARACTMVELKQVEPPNLVTLRKSEAQSLNSRLVTVQRLPRRTVGWSTL
jgi:hypothetical protein